MRTLIGFEIKKIVCKKSFLLTFVLLFGLQVFLALIGSFGNVYVQTGEGQSITGEDSSVVLESFMERNRMDRAAGKKYTGTVFDEAFLGEIREAFEPYADEENEAYLLTDAYRKNARRYEIVLERLKGYTGLYRSGYAAAMQTGEDAFYKMMNEARERVWDQGYCLTEGERTHWEAVQSGQPEKLTFEYCYAYEELTGMQGAYMTHMILVFFFAVTMTFVFFNEVNRNTDQILLCTKKGRGQLYAAKMLAGEIVTLAVTVLFFAALVIGRFFVYGPEGFGARFSDAVAPWYPSNMTMGECLLLFFVILLLSSALISMAAMLLAFATKNGITSPVALVGGLFAARLISIPGRFVFLGKLWHTLPINLLKLDEGFLDMRLFRLFGTYLTVWQVSLVLYAVLIVLLILAGKQLYCRTQVSGR